MPGLGQRSAVDWIEAKQMEWRVEGCLPCHPIFFRTALIGRRSCRASGQVSGKDKRAILLRHPGHSLGPFPLP
jgi:hypothetical protein